MNEASPPPRPPRDGATRRRGGRGLRRRRAEPNPPPRVLSCGVVVVRSAGDDYLFLLLRAFNYWDFPKGRAEAGESPLQTALREVEEETTIRDLQFHWGTAYRETQPYNRGTKVARYYIAETARVEISLPVNPELGRPEHSEYRWVPREQARSMITARLTPVLDWAERILASAPPRRAP